MPTINFSGIASGIDSNSLIDAISQASRQTRVQPSEKKVTELEETNAAFEKLKEKLTSLQSLILKFATLSGGALSKTAVSNDETVLTGSASNSAANGSYLVNVLQLAKNHTHSFDDRFPSTDTALVPGINNGDPAADRTVAYTIGTGSDQVTINVELDSTTKVSDFVSKFNNSTANNGRATATVVNVGTPAVPSYAIVVTTNNEGTQKGQITAVSVGASVAGQGMFAGGSAEDPALDAQFSVTGITGTITRSTNTVSDVVPGLTLNLQNLGSATISIADDVATTTSRVQDFIDAYNEIITYVTENNAIRREEDGEDVENIFGPLSKSRTDDNAITSLRSKIASSVYSAGSTVRIFADLGITTERDGTLKFDTTKFETAIASEPTSVNQVLTLFADQVAVTTGTIAQFVRFNGLIDVTVNGNKSLITNLNDRIAQAEASILQQEDQLRQRFARLESLMGQLQSQQSALTSALAGLGGG